MLLVAPLLMAIGYVPLARRAHLVAAPAPLVVSRVCRCAQVVAADDPNLPKRDAEVESATGGGWSSILPNARGLIIVAALGLTSYFAPDTALGRWLSEPPIQKVAVEQQRDDAGTPYGPTEANQLTGGLGVLVVYNIATRAVAPKLRERARLKAEAEAKEEAEAEARATAERKAAPSSEQAAASEGEGTGKG